MLIKRFTPKLIEPEYLIKYPTFGVKYRGEIRAVLYDLNMRPVFDSGWSDNLITDLGMEDLAGGGGIGYYMNIGSGSTPPAFSDIGLETWLARSQSGEVNTINPTGPLYEFGQQRRGRFNPGVATGWIREMGLSKSNVDNPQNLDVRALLSPAVNKGVDNYLDVYHRMWCYPQLTRTIANLVLAFDGKTYECSTGMHDLDNTHYAQSPYDSYYAQSDSFGLFGANGVAEAVPPGLTDGGSAWTNTTNLGNTWPTGLGLIDRGGASPQWWVDSETYLQLDHGNGTYGLVGATSNWIPHTGYVNFKFVDVLDRTRGIPKDNTMRFRFRARSTVERYVP